MITLERLGFTRESVISVSIEKSVTLEERYRFYPEYTWKVLGFIKCHRMNYLRDMIYPGESRKFSTLIKPGDLIQLPFSTFYGSIKDGMIGENQYSDGSYKVYRLPYIKIFYKDQYNNSFRKEYTFKTEKDLNEFLELLAKKGIIKEEDIFYNREKSELIKDIKL